MKLKLWQVDAFAAKPFGGNPAAIVPLERWLDDAQMQAIAGENNLSETAFLVASAPGLYGLRWFTPSVEIALCGHATLASAFVVFTELAPKLDAVRFETKSGILSVERGADGFNRMALPADHVTGFAPPAGFAKALGEALGVAAPAEFHCGRYLIALWNDDAAIRAIEPKDDLSCVLRGVNQWGLIATAKAEPDSGYDFVSRFFAPGKGVLEDPVTGSAHCALTPLWAKRLGKKNLRARQISPRGGDLLCTDDGARVILSGPCALYMKGEITV